jgi:hypothetical protein
MSKDLAHAHQNWWRINLTDSSVSVRLITPNAPLTESLGITRQSVDVGTATTTLKCWVAVEGLTRDCYLHLER